MMKQFLSATLLSLALVGCAVNPVTGANELVLIEENQEVILGAEVFTKMQEAEGGLYTANPEVVAYVKSVGKKLADVSDRPNLPFEFVVLNNDIPNAWTLPGGKIAINSGLLVQLESEAELAAVLAHEIVHAAARHGAKQLEESLLIDAVSAASCEAAGKNSEPLVQLGNQLIKLKYSRNKEFEADLYGIKYMVKAGYDAQAAVSLQEKFLSFQENRKPGWLEGLFLTHPPSHDRIKANQKTAKKYPPGGFVGIEVYQAQIAKLT